MRTGDDFSRKGGGRDGRDVTWGILTTERKARETGGGKVRRDVWARHVLPPWRRDVGIQDVRSPSRGIDQVSGSGWGG